jgi:pimeloyl-ACP methyl ester carboxylesterase
MPDFTSFDGTRIAYYEWPGSAERPPVVLLHGFIAHANLNWVGPGVVDALTAAGRRVIAPDARGHGESEKSPDPARHGIEPMARDVSALIDHIGAPEVVLVGYSMGGVVSLVTTLRDPRVRRLVVGGIGSGVVEVGGLDSRVIPASEVAAALLAEVPPDPATQPGLFRAFADLVGSDRAALAAVISGSAPASIPVGDIMVPTLVMAGADDPLAARPQVLADAIPGAGVVVLPGDHLTVLRDPAFVPTLVEFVEKP